MLIHQIGSRTKKKSHQRIFYVSYDLINIYNINLGKLSEFGGHAAE